MIRPGWVAQELGSHEVGGVSGMAGERFHAVLSVDRLERLSRSTAVVWRDHRGREYRMRMREFNRLVKKGEWAGPLLYDGLWLKRSDQYLDAIRAVLPEGE